MLALPHVFWLCLMQTALEVAGYISTTAQKSMNTLSRHIKIIPEHLVLCYPLNVEHQVRKQYVIIFLVSNMITWQSNL